MVQTWRDSWFEEGLRVIYLVPRTVVDGALSLTIAPAAQEMARVFVGRVEMMSPAMQAEVESAVAHEDRTVAAKYGRFLDAFWRALHGETTNLPSGLVASRAGGCAQ